MAARRPAADRIDPSDARQVGLDPELPGVLEPLPMRTGGAPITPAEALAVHQRHALTRRGRAAAGVISGPPRVPDELPGLGEAREMTALRLPADLLAYARARAEMEGVTLTAVLEAALAAYGEGSPGTPVGFLVHPTR